ncbi:MAG: hypothetical protein WCP79_11905 [Bacillota bacterium]
MTDIKWINAEEISDESFNRLVADFSCPIDEDIEHFIKDTTDDIRSGATAMRKLAKTRIYLAFIDGNVVGYYATAVKVFDLSSASNALRKEWTGFSNNKTVPAYLIGQLSKNYFNDFDKLIAGKTLLNSALDTIRACHKAVGCKIVFLECQDTPKLHNFYKEHGFVRFGNKSSKGLYTYFHDLSSNI